MKRTLLTLATGLLLTAVATPQDLAPGVLLLSRVRRHIKEELQRLPDVSCLETVRREHQFPRSRMQPLDTVRLEVLTDGSRELFASPGDRRFSTRPPETYVGSGAMGDGFFGLYLNTVLATGNASYVWRGNEEIAGRRLARWDFRLPLMWSGQTITLPEGSGTVSLHGSFWADPDTYDVLRLAIDAGDFPPSLPLTQASWTIDYAPTGLRPDLSVLLPQSADFRMTRFSGETGHNQLAFTQCRIFAAESRLSFDEANVGSLQFGVSSIDDTLRRLPPGLAIPVKLTTRITSDTAVGALIDGEVTDNVRLRQPSALVITAGAPVRGRLRRLERYSEPVPFFVVALEFTQIELESIRYRFDADLQRLEPPAGLPEGALLKESSGMKVGLETVTVWPLPGVATFFFRNSTLDLPVGLRTVWTTHR
jgi:hypothetical protein